MMREKTGGIALLSAIPSVCSAALATHSTALRPYRMLREGRLAARGIYVSSITLGGFDDKQTGILMTLIRRQKN